ncbi:hypothetical protein IQ06DRAFT_288908 [Phaeosphaeriaceae sp. SRC1lsM3a]|nr:hypothetical protein IQ06DRAFT_288908 [Stagonospora sp. SRC1lsM3a]
MRTPSLLTTLLSVLHISSTQAQTSWGEPFTVDNAATMSQEKLLPSSAATSVSVRTGTGIVRPSGSGSTALPQATGAGTRMREVKMGVVGVLAGAAGVVLV